MFKRKFGMSTLNISQGRYSRVGLSHHNMNGYDLAGIDTGRDVWRNFTENLEVIAVYSYSKTGYFNSVHFYDPGNDVTISMTHINNLLACHRVGYKCSIGEIIYQEGGFGSKGPSTFGNHIHMEVGRGRITTRARNKYGDYTMSPISAWMNIEDYFYIDKDYTSIKDDHDYKWEFNMSNFIDGYQCLKWCGVNVHVYKSLKDQKLGMISSETRQTIDTLDADKLIYAKMNANFFDMNNGTHYGVEQSFTKDLAPKQKEWYCLYIDKANKPNYCLSSDYWLSKSEVELGSSPAFIRMHEGKDLNLKSSAVVDSASGTTNHSILLQLDDNSYAFMCTEVGLTLDQCVNFAKAYGVKGVYVYDGGGSTQLIVNGQKKMYTGRKIANALCFYTEKKEEDDTLKTVHVDKVGMYIRDAVKGKVIGWVPAGNSYTFEKVSPVPKRQSDGYQWWHVKGAWEYKGQWYNEGYCQYDSSCYWVE